MEPSLRKTQRLICHCLPIVPLSSGDMVLPTQRQEAEPLLETEGGNTKGGAPELEGHSPALGVTQDKPRLRELSYHKGTSGTEAVSIEVLGDFLGEGCGASQEEDTRFQDSLQACNTGFDPGAACTHACTCIGLCVCACMGAHPNHGVLSSGLCPGAGSPRGQGQPGSKHGDGEENGLGKGGERSTGRG